MISHDIPYSVNIPDQAGSDRRSSPSEAALHRRAATWEAAGPLLHPGNPPEMPLGNPHWLLGKPWEASGNPEKCGKILGTISCLKSLNHTRWGPQDSVQLPEKSGWILWYLYSRYNYSIHGVYKPTNITFGGTILYGPAINGALGWTNSGLTGLTGWFFYHGISQVQNCGDNCMVMINGAVLKISKPVGWWFYGWYNNLLGTVIIH